ncbi:MAG TPA: EAL domain-containing protein [Thermoanaerobaculaceae bacterium]|nr:EAL domain-containing protein [Thermoanaerobaculaceae bacterium]
MEPRPPLAVLVLEENLRLREAVVGALRGRGHTVTVCEDADTAWEAFGQAHHPLVVVGLQRHHDENEALLRRIRELPAGRTPVIVVTAGEQASQRLLPLLHLADDVLARPVRPHAIEMRIAAAERLVRERGEMATAEAERNALRKTLDGLRAQAAAPPVSPLPAASADDKGESASVGGRLRRILNAIGGKRPPEPEALIAPPAVPEMAAPPAVEAPPADGAPEPAEAAAANPEPPAPAVPSQPAAPEGARRATLEWDLKKGEIHFSREWTELFGYRPKEVGHSPDEWFRRVHPQDLDQLKAAIAAHLEGKEPAIENRHRIARADGTYDFTVFRGVATRNDAGVPLRVTGAHADASGTRGFDSLTGLPNRNNLMERLGKALDRSRGGDGRFAAVLFLDLDRFKNINYSLGHTVGDQMLKAVADRLRACLPNGDAPDAIRTTISHVGGDEFAILLEGVADVNDAVRVAKRIQDELQGPFDVEGNEVFTSTSIGIAVSTPEYQRAEDLLRDADTAMFRAKAVGKGSYVVFDAGMHARAVSLLKLETELRRAVQREEFRAYYQPIVELDNGKIVGFEALVRWQHPDGELLLPKDFLAVAEETGLIIGIDRQVARDACKQLRTWNAQFRRSTPLTVSVNVSGVQFMRPDMIVEIDRTLRNYGVYGRSLKLEITESVIMEHARYAADMLQQLKSLDIKLSIDDFGTGYSSLSYLRRFEIDTLKVDSSFVSRMDTDEESWEIIRTIVTLGNNLGKDVVAEGIERGRQRELLLALRCRYGQGFFFSRPVDAETATGLLAAEARGQTLLKSAH